MCKVKNKGHTAQNTRIRLDSIFRYVCIPKQAFVETNNESSNLERVQYNKQREISEIQTPKREKFSIYFVETNNESPNLKIHIEPVKF